MSVTWWPQKIFLTDSGLSVEDNGPEVRQVFTLSPNAPNPFNAATSIRFELYRAGDVSLVVYDSLGRVVARLVEGHLNAGQHAVTWDGTDDAGAPVSSGVYVYRLASRGMIDTGRMTMVR
jgi:hypothetical protein